MKKFLLFIGLFFFAASAEAWGAVTAADSDGDGLSDSEETAIQTDPKQCDTDQDGLSDGLEMGKIHPTAQRPECVGLQAVGSNYFRLRLLDPREEDSDGDRLLDGEEDANFNGWVDFNETDPTTTDTDDDGLSDGLEKTLDKNKDGRKDFDLVDLSNGEDCSPPTDKTDLDCDGFVNGVDEDSDNDGCLDAEEGKADRNDNSILDVWETNVKGCGVATGSGGGGGSGGGPAPSLGSGVEEDVAQKDIVLPSEVLPAKGGGACQLSPWAAETEVSGAKPWLFLVGLFLIVLGVVRSKV